eukprot:TRINITY_DN88_c0_g1_i1.p1 TRINITY_DN88_c0_g1~~TRINITY_DN88_c0_g1_i1.p1  ORF type:complete len:972 (+),score=143.56 TRINITY_DN88_c0_g1_i1:154-3069(+)
MSKASTLSARPAGVAQNSKMGSDIPPSVRKTVQSMKEIVPNSEEEIFAALKECHMDPNEAVQKLITQNPFEEVRQRRKSKKKEGSGTQTLGDGRVRSGSNTGPRGGRSGPLDRGAGRGGSQKFGTTDPSGGRNKPLPPRENGIHPSSRPQGNTPQQLSNAPYLQPKPYISTQSPLPTTPSVGPPSLPNGNAVYTQPPARPQGSWGTGGGISMADIVKSNGTPSTAAPSPSPVVQQPVQPPPISVQAQFLPPPASSSSAAPTTGVYSSASDPVLHHPLEPRGLAGAPIKRDVGTVGGQRLIGERPTSSSSGAPALSSSSPMPIGPPALVPKPSTPISGGNLDDSTVQASPSSSTGPPLQEERPTSADSASLGSHSRTAQSRSTAPNRTMAPVGSQINGRPSTYQPQAVAPKVTPSSTGLEWKKKPATTSSTVGNAPSSGAGGDSAGVSSTSSKLQVLSLQDDKPVMIPSHLQVSEAERTHLSFGSFDAGFGTSFGSGFGPADDHEIPASKPETSTSDSPAIEPPLSSSRQPIGSSATASSAQVYSHPPTSGVMATISSPTAEAATSPVPVTMSNVTMPNEPSKPDSLMQQGPPYPYVPTLQNYPFGLVPQMPGGQYGAYEPSDAQQDVSRLPGLGMPYNDPTGSYYSPGFRPQSETEARYSSPLVGSTTSGSSKYVSSSAGMSSQQANVNESGASALSSAPASSQGAHSASQASAAGQSIPAIPQQPLPLHAGYAAQPAGIPLGPHYAGMYGGFAQYMAPNTAYAYHMHSPYSHPTYGVSPGNNAYPQAPAGTTYPPTAGNNYPPGGAANVKYPSVLPQYKPSSATAGAPHSGAAAGYASYGGAPSGYAAAPAVSTGSASGYEDVSGSQYKDNLYIANQQMSRDMAAGMPTSSYYNISAQGQHTAYGHTQQPTHAHAAYAAGMYHPSQAGPAPTGHQMLQQPQPMGGSGGGGAQGGGYQQQQRAQQSWNNGY